MAEKKQPLALAWLRALLDWELGHRDTKMQTVTIRSVALAFVQHADPDGGNCYPGQRTLVAESGARHLSIVALRQRWEGAGWLTVDRMLPNRLKAYRLTIPPATPGDPAGRSPNGPVIPLGDHSENPVIPLGDHQTSLGDPAGRSSDPAGRSSDLPGDPVGRSNLPDQERSHPERSRSTGDPAGRSLDKRTGNGSSERHDVHLALADSIWSAQEARRRVLRQGGVGQGTRDLTMASEGKRELLARIAEAASDGRGIDRAREDCEHYLAVKEAQARGLGSLRWFNGRWTSQEWAFAMSTTPEEAHERAVAERERGEKKSDERRTYRPSGKETYQGGDDIR